MKKEHMVRAGVGVVVLLLLAALAPVIWALVSAGIGLLALGLMWGMVVVGSMMLPLLGQKLENAILKARKNEAAKNPIEQLQNFFREKSDRVAVFKRAVSEIGAQILSLEQLLQKRMQENPKYDASERKKSIMAMKAAHKAMTEKYIAAEEALKELKVAIADKEFEWKFSQAGQAAMAALSANSGEELMQQMLADTAFASVADNFNRVFSDLELEAQHLTSAKELTYEGGLTIDVSAINLSPVKV